MTLAGTGATVVAGGTVVGAGLPAMTSRAERTRRAPVPVWKSTAPVMARMAATAQRATIETRYRRGDRSATNPPGYVGSSGLRGGRPEAGPDPIRACCRP